ncbi:MAG: hypothetical protein KJS97_03635 [Alphaproteobacteria bacterium]|nr:hypothetical protein [Alphaproteobacteria bacterium]
MTATKPQPARSGQMAITVTGLLIFLSATGAAAPKTVGRLQGLGIGLTEAQIVLHVAPVLIGAVAVVLAQMIAAGRSTPVRFGVYALLGVFTGFILGAALDLFVGVSALITAVFGPGEIRDEHAVGWAVTAMCIAWALMMAAIAVFGTPAARALQDAGGDPECAEVRPRDRALSREGALGMGALGVSTGALTILSQTAASGAAAAVLAAVAALGFIGSTWASWSIWRRSDELQQRAVLQAYTGSALIVTAAVFIWAIATSLGAQLTLSPYALYIGFTVVQFAAAIAANIGSQIALSSSPRGRTA